MADGFRIKVDASRVFRGLRLAEAAVLGAIERGAGKAGLQWMADAIQEPPTVPIDTGDLRGSGSVFLQGRLAGTSPSTGPTPTPATTDDARPGAGEVLVRVGFNKPYAARWHEEPAHFQEPSAGNKYLEAKAAHAGEYVQIVADSARAEIGG